MNAFLKAILVCLSAQVHHTLAETGQCHPPQLDNGVVDGEGDGGSFFKGEFRCNTGFTLSGPTMLKCRNGVWSGSMPICSVFGCDPRNLPNFVNGRRLRVKGTRDSVFKYKCSRGFRLFGPKNVYCTKNGWKMDEIPVCARFGCNEEELLGNEIPHGRKRSMFQGAAYKFYCESGSMMEGSSAVYCDGYSWNGTKPECLVPPTTPELSIELDGEEASEPLASEGQQLKLVCKAQGGNPFPTLAFMLNGERVEADNKEMLEHGGHNAVHTFTVEDHHAMLDMSCIAENRMTSIPVASNHQTLYVHVMYPPSNIQITGPDHLLSADDQSEPNNIFTCSTDESNPAADIDWVIETDSGVETIPEHSTAVETINQGQGWKKISTLSLPSQGTQSVKVHCIANIEDLGFSKKSDQLEVDILEMPREVSIVGPEIILLNSASEFECITQEGDTESQVSMHVTSLNGEPVSFLMESDNKISVTVQEPLEGIIVKCFAENLAGIGPVQAKRVDIHYPPEAQVQDLSVQLTGVEDGSEVTEDSPIEVTCSVLAVPGLSSVKLYIDQKMVHEGSLVPDGQGHMVSSFRWWPQHGETNLECVPELEGDNFAESALISFVVIEGDYGYGEDLYLDDDYEEEYSEPREEYMQEENLQVAEDSTTEKSIDSLYEADSTESNAAWDVDIYGEDEYEDEEYGSEEESTIYEESSDAVSYIKSNNLNHKEAETALDNHKPNAVSEDLFDAMEQKQSFAAAEPGPAVLSHESDNSKHVSADLSGHKSLHSSSGRVCSFNIIIGVFISSIGRLLC